MPRMKSGSVRLWSGSESGASPGAAARRQPPSQASTKTARRGGPPAREREPLPRTPRSAGDPRVELMRVLGDARGAGSVRRFEAAARAFRAERFAEALPLLTRLARDAPEVADVCELHGLVLYRLGRFRAAMGELESFRELSGSVEQHPVLADCHRALARWADVEALWKELGAASPSAELVTEGRLVLAGAKADRGDLPAAIRVLEHGWRLPSRPRDHHLRRAYALADLYERAGRSPRARELFRWVESHDPRLADVSQRVRALI